MKITICGSMAFAKEMLDIKNQLEAQGHSVIVPASTGGYVAGDINAENKKQKMEQDAIRVWFNYIKESDAILVVNLDKNGVANYIGGNALMEMGFAHVLNKKIFLLNPIPQMNYTDEIEAMKPIVINGDLSRVQ